MTVNNKHAYLRDGWNAVDFMVVLLGWAPYLPYFANASDNNLTGVRVVRLLRPLRTLHSIHGLRDLVNGLLKSIPPLLNVLLLFVFCFVLFGIVGIQLFAGNLRQQCYEVDPNTSDWFLSEEESGEWCSLTPGIGRECTGNTTCMPLSNYHTGFDNLWQAFLTIFVSVTLEGWVDGKITLSS